MTCAEVRDRLVEHVLGTASPADRHAVDEHLLWCAGCRHEAMGLAESASVLGHAAGPADPPPGLGDRVASAVGAASGRRRRSRAGVLAAVLAAFLVVGTAGWGTVMAGRAQRLEGAAQAARDHAEQAAREFAKVARDIVGGRHVSEAVLRSESGTRSGLALVLDLTEGAITDRVLVIAGGLPERGAPYRARVVVSGVSLTVGEMSSALMDKSLAAYRFLPGGTSGYDVAEVVDASGRVVLSGRFTG